MDDPPARIAGHLAEIGVEAARRGDREWGVRVPSAKRGAVGVLVTVLERTLALRAFVLRGPDRRHEDVYRRMLRKNLSTRQWRFAVDDAGDVYALADAPLDGLDADVLDGLLGALSALVDETYESLVRTGFDVPEGTEFRPPPDAPG